MATEAELIAEIKKNPSLMALRPTLEPMASQFPKHDDETQQFIDDAAKAADELKQLRAFLQKQMESVFTQKIGFVFQKFPFVRRIVWQQYTPQWCDGDPCSFSSRHRYATLNGPYEGSEWEDEYPEGVPEPTDDQKKLAEDAVHQFLRNFRGDDMESMFGDPVTVTITADGATTEFYESED
jgi:hypothetical protein